MMVMVTSEQSDREAALATLRGLLKSGDSQIVLEAAQELIRVAWVAATQEMSFCPDCGRKLR